MKSKNLEYFLGRICTVFTVPTNRDFKSENPQTFPQPVFHYFVGRVLEINESGIFIEQWNNHKKLKTFFFIDHIVSISEEEILNPEDPKDREVIEEYKKANKEVRETNSNTNMNSQEIKHVDIEGLQKVINEKYH